MMLTQQKMNVDLPLPIIQGIPEAAYESLATPKSIEECNSLIVEIKAQVTDIGLQLTGSPKDEDSYRWKKAALNALRWKKYHITILTKWRMEYEQKHKTRKELKDEATRLRLEREIRNLEYLKEAEIDVEAVKRMASEIKWLRECIGELYDAMLLGESKITTETRTKLKVLADALSNRD